MFDDAEYDRVTPDYPTFELHAYGYLGLRAHRAGNPTMRP